MISIKVESVRYADGELHIKCSPREGIRAALKLIAGKIYDFVLHKEKRSLNANAYAWALIHKIAAELSRERPTDPIEVYRDAVRNLPDVDPTFLCCSAEAAPGFIWSWEEGHLGRQCEQFPSDTPGYVILRCVYGSSDYNRQEMSMLLNRLIQDAQALGIETKDPGDVQSLLKSWKGRCA